jgi:hypothetical protein
VQVRRVWRGGLGALLWCLFPASQVMALSGSLISPDVPPSGFQQIRPLGSVAVTVPDGPATVSAGPTRETELHDRRAAVLETQGPPVPDPNDGTPRDRGKGSEHHGPNAAAPAIRLGSHESERRLHYGVRHRPLGQSDGLKTDQESREAWLGWRTNLTAVTSTIRHTSTYAALQSPQPGTTTLQRRFALDLTLPAWPTVTVAYGQATSNSAPDPIGFTVPLNKADVMETFVTYHLSTVKLRAGTEYAVTDDMINPAGSTLRVRHGISGSYSPLPPLTFTSSVSMTDERNHLSGQRMETPSAEVGLAYRARPDVDVSMRSSYSHSYTNMGNLDLGKFDAKSRVDWNAFRSASSMATLSLETGYSTTMDLLRAAGAMDDLSALVRMTVTGQSWSDWLAR